MTTPDDDEDEDRAWMRELADLNTHTARTRYTALHNFYPYSVPHAQREAYFIARAATWHDQQDLARYRTWLALGLPCDLEIAARTAATAVPDTLRTYVTPIVLLYAVASGRFEPETAHASAGLQDRYRQGLATRRVTVEALHECAALLDAYVTLYAREELDVADPPTILGSTDKPAAMLSAVVKALTYVAAERDEDKRTLHLLLHLAENRGSRAANAYYRRAKQLLPHLDKASHRMKPAALKRRRDEQHEYLQRLTGAKE